MDRSNVNSYGMLFMHLSLSGQGHFGFKTLSCLPEVLIVMPTQITDLGTSELGQCSLNYLWKPVLPREGELCQK